ncbi:class B sortase [Ruminococcaceae bacterium OttesenSCG-928-A16]|nr:class B sortase [Ruminococcaceae bacterium OttesenSCG-928-A16]
MKKVTQKYICLLVAFIACAALLAACKSAPSSSAGSSSFAGMAPSVAPVEETKPLYQSPIDFFELINKNVDISGWITVDGTNIDYPVTRTSDNIFYLTHDSYRNPFAGGGLFIDMANRPDFADPVTVIYGHVMPDDTIFSQLHLYSDLAFFEANQQVVVYTPSNMLTYKIFAAFPHDTSNFLYQKDYAKTQQRQELLDYIETKKENANVFLEQVTAEDQFLLLSTCAEEGQSRYIVAAWLAEKAVE